MTFIERTLEELTAGDEWSPDWHDVLVRADPSAARKPRVSRRVMLALAAVVAAIVVPLGAIAATQGWWFSSAPAPPVIKQRFVAFNAHMRLLNEDAAKRGFRQKAPLAIASRAHGVLALKIPSGLVYLWAAPATGGGVCELLQVPSPRAATRVGLTSVTCDNGAPPSRKLVVSTWGGEVLPDGNLVLGRAFGANSVLVHLSNGTSLHLPVRRSFYVGLIPKHVHPVSASSSDANGKRIATFNADAP
jgi:hypothetical protein